MTDTTNAATNTTTDLPPYYADLAHGGAYERAVAATVAAGLLGQVRPFKHGAAALFGGSATPAPAIEPGDASTAVIDLAEWITTGLHPLAAWRDADEDSDTDSDLGDDTVDAVDMKDPEWRP